MARSTKANGQARFSFLNPAAGEAGRDVGMARAKIGAGPEWAALAEGQVLALASTGRAFTSDDVWCSVPKPREPRALGPILHRLARLGAITRVGFVPTDQASAHRRPIAVWQGKGPRS